MSRDYNLNCTRRWKAIAEGSFGRVKLELSEEFKKTLNIAGNDEDIQQLLVGI
ncbi:hypothetical protein J7L29_03000 [Candidatus Bathyarchaeota archaeon]|nr:hypothetical protein [Candidatus Bathyarchaeota archaeon]